MGRECGMVGLLAGVEDKRWEQRRAVAQALLHSFMTELGDGVCRPSALAQDKPHPLSEVELPHVQWQL